MTLRMGALYDALRSAQGISEELAKKAAEEAAENRLVGIRTRLTLVTWLVAMNIALTVLTLCVLGRLLAK